MASTKPKAPTRTSHMTQKYKVKEKLGKGAFATVRRAIRKSDSKQFALKVVRKKGMDQYNLNALESEVNIMNKISHDHIVQLHDLYDTPNHLHMIIDLLSGGELFDRILSVGHFSEKDAASLVKQISGALVYLHKNKIVHRDLKPENLLFESKSPDAKIKLVDFGLAKVLDNPLTTPCGSPAYVAPEILARKPYDEMVDWWSLGVILYILLCGFPPFHDENNNLKRLYRKIKRGLTKDSFPNPYWAPISKEAKDLVRKLLIVDPKKRANGETVLAHPWIVSNNNTKAIGNHDQLRRHQLTNILRRGVRTVQAILRMVEILGDQQVNDIKLRRISHGKSADPNDRET